MRFIWRIRPLQNSSSNDRSDRLNDDKNRGCRNLSSDDRSDRSNDDKNRRNRCVAALGSLGGAGRGGVGRDAAEGGPLGPPSGRFAW